MTAQLFSDSLVAINIAISLYLWCFISLWTWRADMPALLRRQLLLMISVLFPAMLVISLSHASWGVGHDYLFWIEILLTVLAGPVFFDFVYGRVAGSSALGITLPLAGLLAWLLVGADSLGFAILLPASFTLAAAVLCLLRGGVSQDRRLLHVLFVATVMHLAQLLRFLGRESPWLDELVPFTAAMLGLAYLTWLLLPAQRQARTREWDDSVDMVFNAVDEYLHGSQRYRDPSLKLDTLADELGLRPYLISQAINRRAGRFTDYINRLRVEAFIDDYRGNQNIEALANRVGFRSKSAFYRAFRAATGNTPTQFELS